MHANPFSIKSPCQIPFLTKINYLSNSQHYYIIRRSLIISGSLHITVIIGLYGFHFPRCYQLFKLHNLWWQTYFVHGKYTIGLLPMVYYYGSPKHTVKLKFLLCQNNWKGMEVSRWLCVCCTSIWTYVLRRIIQNVLRSSAQMHLSSWWIILSTMW